MGAVGDGTKRLRSRPAPRAPDSSEVRKTRGWSRRGWSRRRWSRWGWSRWGWARWGWSRWGWSRWGWSRWGWARRGWALLTGALVGVVPYALSLLVVYAYAFVIWLQGDGMSVSAGERERIVFLGYAMSVWVSPTLHLVLAFVVAYWVARGAGSAAAMSCGLLVGVASVLSNLGVDVYFYPPLSEAVTYAVLGVGGGLLGGIRARSVVAAQEALYEASRDVSEAQSPTEVARAVGERLAGSRVAGVTLWEAREGAPAGGLTLLGSWTPRGASTLLPGERLGEMPSLLAHRPFLALGARELPDGEVWGVLGARWVLFLPLVAAGGAVSGLLAVASKGRLGFSGGTVRAYQTAASQVALALENLRLLEEARHAAVLRERQRMAHEIHDTLAQGFTSIIMTLEAARVLPPAEAQSHLEGARRVARENLGEARRLVWALRPDALEGATLTEATERLCASWSEASGVAARVTVTGTPRRLPVQAEAIVLGAAREALSNVRKHANACRAALTLSYMGDAGVVVDVVLDVVDDGVGFDPGALENTPRVEGGFGLGAMRERVEEAGGALSVQSAPGEGTTLSVSLPVADGTNGSLAKAGEEGPGG